MRFNRLCSFIACTKAGMSAKVRLVLASQRAAWCLHAGFLLWPFQKGMSQADIDDEFGVKPATSGNHESLGVL